MMTELKSAWQRLEDFGPSYLRALALDPTGAPRFARLSLVAHFDLLRRGCRGIPRPRSEGRAQPFPRPVVEMFRQLHREHGIRYYPAQNMTVTPANLPSTRLGSGSRRSAPRERARRQIAVRTCYAWVSRAPPKRALWDTTITEVLAGYYEPDARGQRSVT